MELGREAKRAVPRAVGWLLSGLFFLFVAFAFAEWGWGVGLVLAAAYLAVEIVLWRTVLRPVADRLSEMAE